MTIHSSEHNPTLLPELPKSRDRRIPKKVLAAIGASTAAMLVAGGSFLLKDKFEKTAERRVSPVVDNNKLGNSKPEVSEVSEPSDGTFGVINIGRLRSGDKTFTDTRLTGEVITLPKLRPISPVAPFVESSLALFSAYLTTGSSETLNEFSTDPRLKADLEKHRRSHILPIINYSPRNKDLQIVIHDDPKNPAEFTSRSDEFGKTTITLSGGRMYYREYGSTLGDDTWQSPKTREFPALFIVSKLELEVLAGKGHETPLITGFEWQFDPNPDLKN